MSDRDSTIVIIDTVLYIEFLLPPMLNSILHCPMVELASLAIKTDIGGHGVYT